MSRSFDIFSGLTNLLKDSRHQKPQSEEKAAEHYIILRKVDVKDMPRFLVELNLFVDKIDDLLASFYQNQKSQE